MTMITGKENIDMYRMLVLRSRLRLEIKGMRSRGRSTYSIIKEEFNLKGSKAKVLKQLEVIIYYHKELNNLIGGYTDGSE